MNNEPLSLERVAASIAPMLAAMSARAEPQPLEVEFGDGFACIAQDPEQDKCGLWRVRYSVIRTEGRTPFMDGSSAPLFPSEQAAREATMRGLHVVARTGKFPNMCAVF